MPAEGQGVEKRPQSMEGVKNITFRSYKRSIAYTLNIDQYY